MRNIALFLFWVWTGGNSETVPASDESGVVLQPIWDNPVSDTVFVSGEKPGCLETKS